MRPVSVPVRDAKQILRELLQLLAETDRGCPCLCVGPGDAFEGPHQERWVKLRRRALAALKEDFETN